MTSPGIRSSPLPALALLVAAGAALLLPALLRGDARTRIDDETPARSTPHAPEADADPEEADLAAPGAHTAARAEGAPAIDPATAERVAPRISGAVIWPADFGSRKAATLELVRLDPGGKPASGFTPLVSIGRDGTLSPGARRKSTRSDANGQFTLTVPDWSLGQRALLVARSEGLPPGLVELNVPRKGDLADISVPLSRGAALEGVVMHRGDLVPDWTLSLTLLEPEPRPIKVGDRVDLPKWRFTERRRQAKTDAAGRFRIDGLVDQSYSLQCSRVAASALGDFVMRVTPGGKPLTIDLAAAELRVLVESAGLPLAGSRVFVIQGSHRTEFISGEFNRSIEVYPRFDLEIYADHPEHLAQAMKIEALGAGGVADCTLQLERVTRPGLSVVVVGAAKAGIDTLEIEALPLSREGPVRRLRARRQTDVDAFQIAALPLDPGRYGMRLMPGSYVLPGPEQQIEVPESGLVSMTFEDAIGGDFVIEPTSRLERWQATWTVMNADGEEHGLTWTIDTNDPAADPPVEWAEIDEDAPFGLCELYGNLIEFSLDDIPSRFPGRAQATWELDLLPAGRYSVTIESEQHRTVTRDFDLVPGQTTRVAVELEPAR